MKSEAFAAWTYKTAIRLTSYFLRDQGFSGKSPEKTEPISAVLRLPARNGRKRSLLTLGGEIQIRHPFSKWQ
jgi:hypothetical protein